MSNDYSLLLDELAAQADRRPLARPPATQPSRPPTFSHRPLPSARADGQFAKAIDHALEGLKTQHADLTLHNLRPGMGVAIRGRPAVFQIVDVDPTRGRVRVKQARDKSNDPAGVNFVEGTTWVDAAALTHMPDYDAPGVPTDDAKYAEILKLSERLRDGDSRIKEIQARGQKMVAAKRAECMAAINAGQMSAAEAAKAEALLNAFCTRLGI